MKTAAIIDTETDGLDPNVNVCLEVAVILFDLGTASCVSSFSSLIRAQSNAAESINRIPVALLSSAPQADAVWRRVQWYVEQADVVLAHRCEFDRSFMPSAIASLRPWACTKFHLQWPKGAGGDHLVHLALAHGIGVVHAHRAMSDCDTIARLLARVHEMGTPLVPLLERAMRPRTKVRAFVSYDDRELAKSAGFAWDASTKRWIRDMPVDDIAALPFPTEPI